MYTHVHPCCHHYHGCRHCYHGCCHRYHACRHCYHDMHSTHTTVRQWAYMRAQHLRQCARVRVQPWDAGFFQQNTQPFCSKGFVAQRLMSKIPHHLSSSPLQPPYLTLIAISARGVLFFCCSCRSLPPAATNIKCGVARGSPKMVQDFAHQLSVDFLLFVVCVLHVRMCVVWHGAS